MQLVTGLNRVLSWYQKKIGACDKQPWEKTVEQRILRGFSNVPKKTGKIKTELIDVDLVRGSSFPKAKPLYAWTHITRKGLVRIFLLPLFYSWWKQQTSLVIYFILLILYSLQIFSIIIYLSSANDNQEFEAITLTEIFSPSALMIILGTVHSQIVSTHFPSISKVVTKAKRLKRKRKQRIKKNSNDYESRSSQDAASEKIRKTSSLRRNIWRLQKANQEEENRHSSGSYTESASERGEEQLGDVLEEGKGAQEFENVVQNEHLEKFNSANGNSYDENGTPKPFVDSILLLLDDEASQEQSDLTNGFEHLDYVNNFSLKNKQEIDQAPHLGSEIHIDTKLESSQDSTLDCYKELNTIDSKELNTTDSIVHRLSLPNINCPTIVLENSNHCKEPVLRRRRASSGHCQVGQHKLSGEAAPSLRVKCNFPQSLHISQDGRESSYNSSCDSEVDTTSPNTPTKDQVSELEWDDSGSMCMDGNTSDSSDSTQVTDHEIRLHEDPFAWENYDEAVTTVINGTSNVSDRVSCAIWEGNECKKAELSVLDISSAIIQKVDGIPESTEYFSIGLCFACILAFVPILFRLNNARDMLHNQHVAQVSQVADSLMERALGSSWSVTFVVVTAMAQRFCLSTMFFFLLSVAERTFKQRFLYAKHFCQLTSVRRARKSELPHFRLNKVRNIKTWLSVRSYLKKRGPQRSVDVIVSAAFILALCLVSLMCVQLLKDNDGFSSSLYNWELVGWSLAIGLYLLRFMTLGSKINRKYRNLSVLITEQINLYLHMEQKPHKKDELMLANNVLKLAAELLKELESPFKISGISANSYLYNITKVVILSAFSAVLTEMLGFKLKLYKIKIK